jgi:hypothetical protein
VAVWRSTVRYANVLKRMIAHDTIEKTIRIASTI